MKIPENADLRRQLAEAETAHGVTLRRCAASERQLAAERAAKEAAQNSDEHNFNRWQQAERERDAAADLAREECLSKVKEIVPKWCWPGQQQALQHALDVIRSTITDPAAVKQTMENAARYKARRHAIYLTRIRCQISLPKPSEDEFNAEYDAGCDKEREGYMLDHRGVYVKAARKGEEGK